MTREEQEQAQREEAKRQSDMWKAAIERGLQEVQTLRERLKPVAFHSALWDQYHGAYGDIREDVAFLFCPQEQVPEMFKIRRLDQGEKSDYEINFDNLCENLMHQGSLYEGTYLTMPYLVLLLEKKRRAQDYEWEKRIISGAGDILSTDLPHWGRECKAGMPKDVLESYELSVELLKEMTKDFIKKYWDRLKKEEPGWLQYFCTALLAILGDREAAHQMAIGTWEQCPLACPECDFYDEDMEADGFYNEEQLKSKVEPAASVIGKWDKESYEDTYLWFSNLAEELGAQDAWKIPYYYGTYTCPECGSKGVLIDWMKEYEING